MRLIRFLTLAALSTASAAPSIAHAEDVNFYGAVAVQLVMREIVPQFEAATGHKVVLKFDVNPTVKKNIDGGEQYDVVLINPPMIDDLIAKGNAAAGSRIDLGRIPMGLAIRAGAKKPDISTVDAFKRTLLAAKSVAYVGEGSSGIYFDNLVHKLGITAQMKGRLVSVAGGQVGVVVGRGDAELGVNPVMNIHAAAPAAEVGGIFPAELQSYIDFAIARSATTKQVAASDALIRFLTDRARDAAYAAKGLERTR